MLRNHCAVSTRGKRMRDKIVTVAFSFYCNEEPAIGIGSGIKLHPIDDDIFANESTTNKFRNLGCR